MPATILFVDDEPALRLTFPALLEPRGFQVEVAGTVSEALEKIQTRNFDVLISDLNIGEPGDGFTLVSVMKRTQPACRNFIMTGYPAFEAALEAIRSQVDGFFLKPADVDTLVTTIDGAVAQPFPAPRIPKLHIADLLRQHSNVVAKRALGRLQATRTAQRLRLNPADWLPELSALVLGLADRLDSANPNEPSELGFRASFEHGRARYAQGYSLIMLVEDANSIQQAVCDAVEENLMSLDLSRLMTDLKHLMAVVEGLLTGAMLGFLAQQHESGRNLLGVFWQLVREASDRSEDQRAA